MMDRILSQIKIYASLYKLQENDRTVFKFMFIILNKNILFKVMITIAI